MAKLFSFVLAACLVGLSVARSVSDSSFDDFSGMDQGGSNLKKVGEDIVGFNNYPNIPRTMDNPSYPNVLPATKAPKRSFTENLRRFGQKVRDGAASVKNFFDKFLN